MKTLDRALAHQGKSKAHLANHIVMIGRISHQHNVQLGIWTLEKLHEMGYTEFTLSIFGEGEESRQLIKLINTNPCVDSLEWQAKISLEKIPTVLEDYGILLITSRYEAQPITVNCALYAGCAVVSTEVGSVPEMICPMSGVICDDTPESLADGILEARNILLSRGY